MLSFILTAAVSLWLAILVFALLIGWIDRIDARRMAEAEERR